MTLSRAVALLRAGDLDNAERLCRELLRSDPSDGALGNLALILKRRGDLRGAEQALIQAERLNPIDSRHPYNLGNLYWKSGRLGEASDAYRRALSVDPTNSDAKLNLGIVRLALGDEEDGWRLYDSRPERLYSQTHKLGFPEWQGEPLRGKRLFIWTEQGFGDAIFAARYLHQIEASEVTFVTRPPLAPLFEQLPAKIMPRTGPMPVEAHDYWTLPLSLPRWLRPQSAPYLSANPSRVGGIGIMWRGNQLPDPARSLPETDARRLLAIPGAISLQPEDTGAGDFRETAQIIAGLDMVITIDTSVAHLTGALGKPGIVLLQHYYTDWRWREREPGQSYWYPSLRLLRQETPGDWRSVLDKAISASAP